MNDDIEATLLASKIESEPTIKRAPGRLAGSVKCVVQTVGGMRLIEGRHEPRKPMIRGLLDFSRRANLIYRMAAGGDPFADYQLVQLEVQIEEVDKILQETAKQLIKEKDATNNSYVFGHRDRPRLEFSLPESVAPLSYEFRHLGHYATSALQMILQTDDILAQLLTMEYHNLLTKSVSEKRRAETLRKMRGVLSAGATYQYTGCTRQDLKSKNQVGLSAVQKHVEGKFLDPEMYRDEDDICETFAEYDVLPEFGPWSKT